MKHEKKGLTVQEQYLVTQLDWWNADVHGEVKQRSASWWNADVHGEVKQRSASTLRKMIQRRHEDWDWKSMTLLVKRLREPITSKNVDDLTGSICGWWGPKGEHTYMYKWASKKRVMLKLAFAEQEIEGKSTEEISRMLLLETL